MFPIVLFYPATSLNVVLFLSRGSTTVMYREGQMTSGSQTLTTTSGSLS